MHVALVAHAGGRTGVGHLVRVIALAEEVLGRGHTATLIGNAQGEAASVLLAAVPALRHVHTSRPTELREAVMAERADVVHLDTYDPLEPLRWWREGPYDGRSLLAQSRPLVSVVHDGAWGLRDADLLVDPTPGARVVREGLPSAVGRGSGLRWAPLRRSVTAGRWPAPYDATAYPGRTRGAEAPLRVLVVMGGTDPDGVAAAVVDLVCTGAQAIKAAGGVTLTVIAPHGPSRQAVEAACERAAGQPGLDARVSPPTADFPDLARGHDIVISGSGTTLWELCCLGLPVAAVRLVANQAVGYRRILEGGAAVGLGGPDDLRSFGAYRVITDLLGDAALRAQLATRGRNLVDGGGAWRWVEAWEQLLRRASTSRKRPGGTTPEPVQLRPAGIGDAARLLQWRNDPATRSVSRTREEVVCSEHVAWLRRVLADPDRVLSVGLLKDAVVGTIRWDRVATHGVPGTVWEVSITVAPEWRGRGLAAPLLAAALEELARRQPDAETALATVHAGNAASRAAFEGSGWVPDAPPDAAGWMRFATAVIR